MGRALGIDHGEKRIGLALSDSGRLFARPLEVIEGEARFFRRLSDLVAEQEIEEIVLGLPLNMDGSQGPKAAEVLAFKERLEVALADCGAREGGARHRSDADGSAAERGPQVPVTLWDERLTTVQAERAMAMGGLRSRERRARVDKVAAQVLLQSYLDAQTGGV